MYVYLFLAKKKKVLKNPNIFTFRRVQKKEETTPLLMYPQKKQSFYLCMGFYI